MAFASGLGLAMPYYSSTFFSSSLTHCHHAHHHLHLPLQRSYFNSAIPLRLLITPHLTECSDPWKRAAFPTDDDDDAAAAAAAAENGYGVPKFSDNNTSGIEEGADESKNWNSEALWFAIVAIIMAAGLAVGILLKKTSLLGGTRSEASHLLADLSSTTSGSSEMAAKFHVNLWVYFFLLMAAGFGLFVSEEALNVWVGTSLGRCLTWDKTREVLVSSLSANASYITSTVLWVYWGVCISDMVPFYAGRIAAKSGTGKTIWEKLGVKKEKFEQLTATVQRYGNLIGFVERFSVGVRNPTSFLAGFVGISPSNYFLGVCLGGLITLPIQIGIGVLLRDRPVAALAGVAAAVGIWSILPYAAAAIASAIYVIHQNLIKQSF
ncbi:hypothetical protein CY35_07G027700 [Sphagnum magellanicum]|uniref:Uncharacterized protein n=1 Tax=Sphagnum magellanicum TaxID=128215 RepID=A0ACB8HJN3_9BRYO|nr:hypothetical protein CY35_07G027700 [Sphagnum magellanicum]